MKIRYSLPALVLAAACSYGLSGVQTQAATKIPAGWKTSKVTGFSIALPKDWQVVDLGSKDAEKRIDKMTMPKGLRPAAKEGIKALARQGIFRLYAFGPKVKDGFPESLNVNVLPTRGMTLKQIQAENVKQFAAGGVSLKSSIKANPDRVVLDAEMPAVGANGPFKYATHAFVLIHGKDAFTFTFSVSPPERARIEALAKDAIKTIKFD